MAQAEVMVPRNRSRATEERPTRENRRALSRVAGAQQGVASELPATPSLLPASPPDSSSKRIFTGKPC